MVPKINEDLFSQSNQVRIWLKMLAGKSYYHNSPNIGKAFEPGKLRGYFKDFTAKTQWTKEVDSSGAPVNTLSNGQKIQFPILICQKALGHWDRWLIEESDADRLQFLTLCEWLVQHQDENGGWDTWQAFRGRQCSNYSAMAQGQALSVLLRAFELTRDSRYKQAAEKAFGLFLVPVEKGGVTYFEKDEVLLEEAPFQPRNTILNGWIYALFGLYDHILVLDDAIVKDMFERSIDTLAQHLPGYDSGYWSYYDSQKHLSSPYYHRSHISQLEALCLISQVLVFKKYHRRWTIFQNSFINKSRAFLVKALQKLKEPPRITIVE